MHKKSTFVFLLSSLLLFLSSPSIMAAQTASMDKVVAVVNSDVITQTELTKQLVLIKLQLQNSQVPLPSNKELQAQVLNHLIDEKVQLQTAERAGIVIDDSTLDTAINKIAERNQLTPAQFQEAVVKEGMNFKDYKEKLRKQLIIERLLQTEVGSQIQVSDQEVDKYINSVAYSKQSVSEYHLYDILIALPEIPSSAQMNVANKKAQAIIAQLNEGKNFAEIAAAKSDGQEALQGGDLGWRRIEEIPTIFATQITTLKIGDVLGPVRAPNGLHILKLIATRGSVKNHAITETKVRHILLKNNTLYGDAETQQMLVALREQIKTQAQFIEAAKKYSEDKGAAINGGDLNWVKPGQLTPPFEQAMNQLQKGAISQPVKSQFGWHLILVEDRRDKDDTTQYQRDQVRKLVSDRKFREESQLWTKRMRDISFVKITTDPAS